MRRGAASWVLVLERTLKQRQGVVDQCVDECGLGHWVVPGDERLARGLVVVGSERHLGAPGTTRRTRRIAAISWVTVSWVATASSSRVESRARRVLPFKTPVASITERTASKIRSGRSELRRRVRQ